MIRKFIALSLLNRAFDCYKEAAKLRNETPNPSARDIEQAELFDRIGEFWENVAGAFVPEYRRGKDSSA